MTATGYGLDDKVSKAGDTMSGIGDTISLTCDNVSMSISIDQRFGRWTVIDPEVRLPRKGRTHGYRAAVVKCDCGDSRTVLQKHLLAGRSQSCGCLQREHAATLNLNHGLGNHYLFDTWRHMVSRCHTPGAHNWDLYGARGIQVWEGWRESPAPFIEWIEQNLGQRPDGYSLDRIENDGNYEPGNVRWADWPTQRSNQRKRAA